MPRRLFHTLDGLRGLAAAAVILIHMRMIFPAAWFPGAAYLAVDLFFGLSGFVLAEAYSARLDAGLTFFAFMQKRILRLWPLYALGLFLGTAEAAAKVALHYDPPSVLLPVLPALFYIPWNGPRGALYPLNFPAWSLFYELIVNILMAAAWRKLTTRVLIVLVGFSAIGLIAAAIRLGSLNTGFSWEGAPVAAARVGFSFFLGILLWRAKPRPRALSAWVPMVLLAVGLMANARWLPYGIVDVFEVFLLFPLIIWLGASTQPAGISLIVFEFVGVASYALYAVHVPMMRLFAIVLGRGLHISVDDFPSWACVALLAGLIVFGWLLNGVDVALRARLERLIRWGARRPASAAPPIPAPSDQMESV
jgi:peptidoglycan/LPS O-acetylase OafA/YrhL